MSDRENKEHNVALERERLKQLIEEMEHSLPGRFDIKRFTLTIAKEVFEKLKAKHSIEKEPGEKEELLDAEFTEELASAINGLEEIITKLLKTLTEIKEEKREKFNPAPNKYYAIRKLSEFLENFEYTAEEIDLLKTLIEEIVQRNNGSLEPVLKCLYLESAF